MDEHHINRIAEALERIAVALEEANQAHYLTAANSFGWACRCGWRSRNKDTSITWEDHLKGASD